MPSLRCGLVLFCVTTSSALQYLESLSTVRRASRSVAASPVLTVPPIRPTKGPTEREVNAAREVLSLSHAKMELLAERDALQLELSEAHEAREAQQRAQRLEVRKIEGKWEGVVEGLKAQLNELGAALTRATLDAAADAAAAEAAAEAALEAKEARIAELSLEIQSQGARLEELEGRGVRSLARDALRLLSARASTKGRSVKAAVSPAASKAKQFAKSAVSKGKDAASSLSTRPASSGARSTVSEVEKVLASTH